MDSFRKRIEWSINIYTSLYSCLRNSSSIPPRTFSVVSQIQQPIFPWGLKEGKKNSSKKFDDQSTVVYFETQRKAPLTKKKSGGSIKGRNSFLENVDKFLEFFSRTRLFYFLTVVVENKLITFALSLYWNLFWALNGWIGFSNFQRLNFFISNIWLVKNVYSVIPWILVE